MFTTVLGKSIVIDSQHVAVKSNPANIEATLLNGQAVVLQDGSALDSSQEVDLGQVAAKLRDLMDQVNGQFIDRAELIEAFMAGLCANEHTFALSQPGTAKTSVVKTLAKGFSGKVWGTVMNPDLPRDALVGTIDPAALQGGKWTRRWAGIATADIAILDEVWKSSAQNSNILLDALEERKVREGDDEISIPLIAALSMSNEVPDDSERAAIYDRFLVRLSLGYLKDAGDFAAMLTASAGGCAISQTVSTDELRLMGAAAEYLALNAPADVVKTMQALWRDLGQNGRAVSDRRWRRTLKLAAAYSLLKGEDFHSGHLIVAKWTLWTDPDQETEIRELVMSKTDPLMGDVLAAEALLADLQSGAQGLDAADLKAKAEIASKCGKLKDLVKNLHNKPGIDKHATRLVTVYDAADKLQNEVIGMF